MSLKPKPYSKPQLTISVFDDEEIVTTASAQNVNGDYSANMLNEAFFTQRVNTVTTVHLKQVKNIIVFH